MAVESASISPDTFKTGIGDAGLTKIETPFGLPPHMPLSRHMIDNSMPILEITPADPSFVEGLTVFTADPNVDGYRNILRSIGYEIDSASPIRIAYLADNFPTDTVTNDYGESFLNKITDLVSTGASDLVYMFGGRNASDTLQKMLNLAAGMFPGGEKAFGLVKGKLEDFGNRLAQLPGGGLGRSILSNLNVLLAGHRVDFPMIWRNSSYQPSYEITVRLWNPAPGNARATNKFIVGPIVALLLLATPRSVEKGFFKWPFLIKAKSKGIFTLDPGFISNISIIKGGEQISIGYNQRLSIVDVRISMGSLYSHLITTSSGTEVPDLRKYARNLRERTDISDVHALRGGEKTIEPTFASQGRPTNPTNPAIVSANQIDNIPTRAPTNVSSITVRGNKINWPGRRPPT